MPAQHAATTVRFTPEDREVIEKLRKLTGITDNASIIRYALRETLTVREALAATAKRGAK